MTADHLKTLQCLRWLAPASFALACVISFAAVSPVRADGLIYQLPPDGSWVCYDVTMDAAVRADGMDESSKMAFEGALRLSSVGQRHIDGKPCRWIEIEFEIGPAGTDNKTSRVVKLLVPDEHLKRGHDPFAHVLEMYYSQTGGGLPQIDVEKIDAADKINGSDYPRRQYELDRLRSVFPRPLTETQSETKTISTKLDRFECENLTGTSELPESPLRGGGQWAWRGEFDCCLSEKIPFGVAVLQSHTKGHETTRAKVFFDTQTTLTVAEVGANAKSSLPLDAAEPALDSPSR